MRNFLLVLFMCSTVSLIAQDSGGKTIFFDQDPTGKINRVQLEDDNATTVGNFLHKKLSNGTTEIGIDYSVLGSSGVRIELRKQGRTVYLDESYSNGPSPQPIALSTEPNTIYHSTYFPGSTAEEEDWIIFVLAVAYCCVEIEVSHNEDDSYSSSITFDCDCFSISLSNASILTSDGQEFNDVDEIVLTAI